MRLVRPPLFFRAALLFGRLPVFACSPEEAPSHGGLPVGAYERHACAVSPLEAFLAVLCGSAPPLSPIEQRPDSRGIIDSRGSCLRRCAQ
jgi:hypothetical protein